MAALMPNMSSVSQQQLQQYQLLQHHQQKQQQQQQQQQQQVFIQNNQQHGSQFVQVFSAYQNSDQASLPSQLPNPSSIPVSVFQQSYSVQSEANTNTQEQHQNQLQQQNPLAGGTSELKSHQLVNQKTLAVTNTVSENQNSTQNSSEESEEMESTNSTDQVPTDQIPHLPESEEEETGPVFPTRINEKQCVCKYSLS